MNEEKQIKFPFHPYQHEKNNHTVEKVDVTGAKRKYLLGISSGLDVDAHGERMTEKCIKSFMDQANEGDILLFADVHGIKESTDIGLLEKAEITATGDWKTEYRLYDENDDIGIYKKEVIDTIWKQINGLPPYKKPRQKGFSVEGFIPSDSILYNSDAIKKGVLDNILLNGVILVPRPAYKASIATSIYKALGETSPERKESLKMTLRRHLEQEEINDKYYRLKWKYQDVLENVIEKTMLRNNNNKEDELDIIFDEYKDLTKNLIMQSEGMFVKEQDSFEDIDLDIAKGLDKPYGNIDKTKPNSKLELYKSLLYALKNFSKMLEVNNGKK